MPDTNGELPRHNFQLTLDDWGRLIFEDGPDRRFAGVEAIRTFPITDPNHFIALVSAEGKEIAWIEDLDALPAGTRKILESALAHKQFMPVIRRILRISRNPEPNDWDVETDRGPTRFTLKSDEDIRRLAGHRVLIVDAHGLRYLIPDLKQMDGQSRRYLERYI